MRAAGAANGPVPGWDPDAFNDQSTLQIMTTAPEEGEHWSKAVAGRNRRAAICPVRRAIIRKDSEEHHEPILEGKGCDKEFDRVRWEPALDMKDKVAAAMADKYFMDILIRHESHPMTARLVAEPTPAPSAMSK